MDKKPKKTLKVDPADPLDLMPSLENELKLLKKARQDLQEVHRKYEEGSADGLALLNEAMKNVDDLRLRLDEVAQKASKAKSADPPALDQEISDFLHGLPDDVAKDFQAFRGVSPQAFRERDPELFPTDLERDAEHSPGVSEEQPSVREDDLARRVSDRTPAPPRKRIHPGWIIAGAAFVLWWVLFADPGGKKACLEEADRLTRWTGFTFTCVGHFNAQLTLYGQGSCTQFSQYMAKLKVTERDEPYGGAYVDRYAQLFGDHYAMGTPIHSTIGCDGGRPFQLHPDN